MTLNTTNLGAQSPLPEGGKSLRIPIERTSDLVSVQLTLRSNGESEMGTPGPQKVNRYGFEFKLKSVAMSNEPGVRVQDVAKSLCIHPFMLSRWRNQVKEGHA